jgi:hypothetical protein
LNWYRAESTQKSVKQIVLLAGPEQDVATKFGTLLLTGKFMALVANTWSTGFFFLDSDSGPFLMVRGDKVAGKLKGSPLSVAFCFYRMTAGGLVTIYVHVDCPSVAQMLTHGIVLFEIAYGLDDQNNEMKRTFERAIGRDSLHLCFGEGEGPGGMSPSGAFESTGIRSQFDVVMPLSHECRTLLKYEYEAILGYHAGVSSSRRDYNRSVQQMWAENPQGSNPILPRPAHNHTESAGNEPPEQVHVGGLPGPGKESTRMDALIKFSENDTSIGAECPNCQRVLKIPKTSVVPTANGSDLRQPVSCPCKQVYRSIKGASGSAGAATKTIIERAEPKRNMPEAIIVLAGPGREVATESVASRMRRDSPGCDVLLCRSASDVRRDLALYGEARAPKLMLLYDLPTYATSGTSGRTWLHGYMMHVESEVARRTLLTRPNITVVAPADGTGGIYLRCPWESVRIQEVVLLVEALDAAFAEMA